MTKGAHRCSTVYYLKGLILLNPLPIIILYLLPSSLILAQVTSKAPKMLGVSKVPSSSMTSLFDS